MGFSLAGLLVGLAILLPSLLLLAFPARDAPPLPPESLPLTGLERGGQMGCLVLATIIASVPGFWWWGAAVVVCVLVYYGLWVRFFSTGRPFAALYEPLGPIPVPMAVFPVLAFLACAAWLANWWLAAAALVLAIAHITTSLKIARALREPDSA